MGSAARKLRGLVAAAAVVGADLAHGQTMPVDVVEFYNATLDHYFISALAADITALDSGRLVGWTRTGKTFGAYLSATAGASPVCRFYLPPANGDSHFYSASPAECSDVKTKFPSFVYESPNVMYIGLPDAATGACPAGFSQVYRLWNKRADSNHRYTTEKATRDAMLVKGYVPEGYGPDGVAMCAPVVAVADKRKDAARFLRQATFGAPREAIDALVAQGYSAWLDEQFAMPAVSHKDTVLADPLTAAGDYRMTNYRTLWKQRFEGRDQLRQRINDALLQIYVISYYNNRLGFLPCGVASYLDVLNRDAFGNFRDLLRDVTLHPVMGLYLSMLGSGKADPVLQSQPDENYGRELLQLFSIGLVMLNEDGTPWVGVDGKPVPTYSQETVQAFARALSGWINANADQSAIWMWNGIYFNDPDPAVTLKLNCDAWSLPMTPWVKAYRSADGKRTLPASPHDTGEKLLLLYAGAPSTTLPAGQTAQADLENLLDNVFNHPNVGPFIGKQLIKRLVTSNPSPQYVARVARKFNDNGSGVRGDMRAVIRAIVLDDEARSLAVAQQPSFGKLTEPVVRLVQFYRSFNGVEVTGNGYNLGYSLDSPNVLNQQPLKSPTVFNFYGPEFQPAGPLARANLVGPEFDITTTSTVASFANNTSGWIQGYGVGSPSCCVMPNYTYWYGLTSNPVQLVDELDLLLCAQCLNTTLKSQIVTAIGAIKSNNVPSSSTLEKERLYTALGLILNSPDYLVQK
jgi:uncharacterized protein (DUF1800 family)